MCLALLICEASSRNRPLKNRVGDSGKGVGRSSRLPLKSVIANSHGGDLWIIPRFLGEDIKSAFYFISLFKKDV